MDSFVESHAWALRGHWVSGGRLLMAAECLERQAVCGGAGVTLAVMLGCTSVVLFVGACIAGSTAFTLALGAH